MDLWSYHHAPDRSVRQSLCAYHFDAGIGNTGPKAKETTSVRIAKPVKTKSQRSGRKLFVCHPERSTPQPENQTLMIESALEQKQKQQWDLAPDDISCTNNETRYRPAPVLCKIPADSHRLPSRFRSLKTSLPVFLVLLPWLFGLTFDNKNSAALTRCKDVLHRRLTRGEITKHYFTIGQESILHLPGNLCSVRLIFFNLRTIFLILSNAVAKPVLFHNG